MGITVWSEGGDCTLVALEVMDIIGKRYDGFKRDSGREAMVTKVGVWAFLFNHEDGSRKLWEEGSLRLSRTFKFTTVS